MQSITSKFSVGQEVWYLGKSQPTVRIPCAFCAATGKIVGANDEERKCPACCGRGSKSKRQPRIWVVRGSGLVTQIKMFVDDKNISASYILDTPDAVDCRVDECPACGFEGSYNDSIFDEAELFGGHFEAQEICNKRNFDKGKEVAK